MKKIILDLKEIAGSEVGAKETKTLNDKLESPDEKNIEVTSPITGTITFTNLGQSLLAAYDLKISIRIICFRCAKKFLKTERFQGKKNFRLKNLAQGHLDITPTINEEIILAMPIKPLCKKECRGLCPNCGQDLNDKQCRCKKVKIRETKPLSKLKSLLK